MKILILAGGGGTRLWPLSRTKKPKQFHRLVGQHSLLQLAVRRLQGVRDIKTSDVYISTNEQFVSQIKQQTKFPAQRLIVEPAKRDTAAAVGLAAVTLAAQLGHEQEVVGMVPCDPIIHNEKLYRSALSLANKMVLDNPEQMVIVGVRPTFPATALGYIEISDERHYLDKKTGLAVYRINSFKEKPNQATAEKFLQNFHYLWNMGMYFFRIDTLLQLYKKFAPELYTGLMIIYRALQKGNADVVICRIYPQLPAISLDYAVSEKNKNFLVIPLDNLGWTDIGYFQSLWDILPKDKQGNVVQGKNVLLHQTKNSLVYSDKRLIACVGMDDVAVIDTGDSLLVTRKNEAQGIKELLKLLETTQYKKLL